jgi:hypothetical protein
MRGKMMDDVENVGIMQGFLDKVREEEDDLEEEEDSEEGSSARMLDRKPDSPEILMNNLRGDMRSVDARREELADLVGYKAAAETPDSVLAMLQPVLAQGAGLGALPQSGPMAQGPQAPMPPPPGGEMGMPPQPAPPAPSGGDMAALLAAATPAPGGGMAPGGAMMGPNGQPIPPEGMPPIQMRDGGFVQRFRDGSDEEGVTPSATQMPSSPFEDLLTNLGKPKAEISIGDAMQRRMAQYEELGLAPSQQSAKANILFDIAGAALGYAANRGPGGEALSGDGLGRFAAAFSALPAAIQKRVADIQDTRRQLSLYALEASEKEQQEIRDYNARLQSEQNDILMAAVREQGANERAALAARTRMDAASIAAAGKYGGGLGPRWAYDTVTNSELLNRYARGETTEDETALVQAANALLSKPVTTIDENGDTVTIPGMAENLPMLKDAMSARAQGASAATAAPPEAAPQGTVPLDAFQVPPSVDTVNRVESSEPATLLSLAEKGTGFVPTALSGVVRNIPADVAGTIRPDLQSATQTLPLMVQQLTGIFTGKADYSVREFEGIRDRLSSIDQRLFSNTPSYYAALDGVDRAIESLQGAAADEAENTDLARKDRNLAKLRLSKLQRAREVIGVQNRRLFLNDPQSQGKWASAPSGTVFLLMDQEGNLTPQVKPALAQP